MVQLTSYTTTPYVWPVSKQWVIEGFSKHRQAASTLGEGEPSDLLKVTRTLSNRWPLTAPTTGQILLHRSMLTWTVVTCNWQKRQKHILKMTEKNLAFEGKDPTEMSGVMDTQRLNISWSYTSLLLAFPASACGIWLFFLHFYWKYKEMFCSSSG